MSGNFPETGNGGVVKAEEKQGNSLEKGRKKMPLSWLYPEDYTPPSESSPVELTTTERDELKTWLKTKLNDLPSTEKIRAKEGIEMGLQRTISEYGKHIHDRVIKEMLVEIMNEWYPDGPPGSEQVSP